MSEYQAMVAEWFAHEIVANELFTHDREAADLPLSFRDLVAAQMVRSSCLGCPDVEEAKATLAELYGWGV